MSENGSRSEIGRHADYFQLIAGFKIGEAQVAERRVKLGCERLMGSERELIAGKQVGIITNHSGVLPEGEHIVDVLRTGNDVSIKALFSPEHGIRGDAPAGKHLENEVDPKTGVQVYSLYGDHNKPDVTMLSGIDVLIYDIQDVGVRFYTYISTLALVMEAAAENDIPLVLLDRPLVLPGHMIDGPVLNNEVRSFVGMLPIPVLYSLTPGELAGLIRREYLAKKHLDLDLTVMKLENYSRSMWYDETGLNWLPPSPNIPAIDTAAVYPGTALIEGTNVSEGRGTESPFRLIGAPFVDKMKLADSLNSLELPGLKFNPVDFTPRGKSIVSHTRFKDELCHGIELVVTRRDDLKPFEAGVAIVCALRKLNPSELVFRDDCAFDRLAGNKEVRELIERGADYLEIASTWEHELEMFRSSMRRYFLY